MLGRARDSLATIPIIKSGCRHLRSNDLSLKGGPRPRGNAANCRVGATPPTAGSEPRRQLPGRSHAAKRSDFN
jgi:hypothetical protein